MTLVQRFIGAADVGLTIAKRATQLEKGKNVVLGAGYGVAARPAANSFPALRLPGMARDGMRAAAQRHESNPAIIGLDVLRSAVQQARALR